MAYDVLEFLERLFPQSSDLSDKDAGTGFEHNSNPADRSFGPDDHPSDWRIEWEERAAIREFDGGQVREHAEAEALEEIAQRMRRAEELKQWNADSGCD